MNKGKSSRVADTSAFSEALSKIVSISRADVQKRLEIAPKEPISKHKRYKYAPEGRPSKP